MSAINYERAVELTAQMAKKYRETENSLASHLSEKRTAAAKARNAARMQEELAAKETADEKRRQETAAAEKRRREAAAAAEKRRQEVAAAAERKRQEEAAAAEKRRREEKEAEERRRRKLALYRGSYNVVIFSILLMVCVAGLYIFWMKGLPTKISKTADKLYIGPISHSLLLISLSYYLFKRRFSPYRLVEFVIIIGLMTAIYYPLTTRYATEYYYQFFSGGMSFAVLGVWVACYRRLRSRRSFRYLWWVIASFIFLIIMGQIHRSLANGFATVDYRTVDYHQLFLGGMIFALPGVWVACYRGLRSGSSFRYLWWIIASFIILPIISFFGGLIWRFVLWIVFGIASIFYSGANSEWFFDYTEIPFMWFIGLVFAVKIIPED